MWAADIKRFLVRSAFERVLAFLSSNAELFHEWRTIELATRFYSLGMTGCYSPDSRTLGV